MTDKDKATLKAEYDQAVQATKIARDALEAASERSVVLYKNTAHVSSSESNNNGGAVSANTLYQGAQYGATLNESVVVSQNSYKPDNVYQSGATEITAGGVVQADKRFVTSGGATKLEPFMKPFYEVKDGEKETYTYTDQSGSKPEVPIGTKVEVKSTVADEDILPASILEENNLINFLSAFGYTKDTVKVEVEGEVGNRKIKIVPIVLPTT